MDEVEAGGLQAVVWSFGYLHGSPPEADVTADLRRTLRNPDTDPALRALTGLDQAIRDTVWAAPGATGLCMNIAAAARGLIAVAAGRLITVGFGCAGGRHRSVVLAEECGAILRAAGWRVEVRHRDIGKQVVVARGRHGPDGPPVLRNGDVLCGPHTSIAIPAEDTRPDQYWSL